MVCCGTVLGLGSGGITGIGGGAGAAASFRLRTGDPAAKSWMASVPSLAAKAVFKSAFSVVGPVSVGSLRLRR